MKTLIARLIGMYLNILSVVSPTLAARKAFAIFCRPFRLRLTEKQLKYFASAEQFTLDHEQLRVKVYKWGQGEKKVLFLHGWQSHTYRWKQYIEALSADEYTIYSLDAPGHGQSSGNFLTVPLYSEVIEKFIRDHGPFESVVGHSIGGFTLVYTLFRLPLLPVNKIVLLAPPGEADEFVAVFKNTLGLTERTVELVVGEFVRRYDVKPDFFSIARFAESLNHTGLIIHDEEDDEAPYRHAVRLQERWRKSKLITTQGLGHNLRSSEVVTYVVDFIGKNVHDTSPVLQ